MKRTQKAAKSKASEKALDAPILESLSERQDNLQDAIVQISKAIKGLSDSQLILFSKLDQFLTVKDPPLSKDVKYYN